MTAPDSKKAISAPRRPMILCPSCAGLGKVCVPETLWQTFLVLRLEKEATAADLLPSLADSITANAVNNRLEKLRLLGYVTRRRRGKFWLYKPI